MEDKSTCQILTDKKLEKLLSPPVKGNTFIKSYYDGLVFIFPKVIIITRIDGTIPTARVLQVLKDLYIRPFES
jgi:hypothetical protein